MRGIEMAGPTIAITFLSVAVLFLNTEFGRSDKSAEVVAQEKSSWRAWQTRDIAFWQRHLSADHIDIDGLGGPVGKDEVIKGIATRKCNVTSYDLSDFMVRQPNSNTIILVYRAAQNFDCGRGAMPMVGWITSVYEHRNHRWQNVLFEHLPVKNSESLASIRPGPASPTDHHR